MRMVFYVRGFQTALSSDCEQTRLHNIIINYSFVQHREIITEMFFVCATRQFLVADQLDNRCKQPGLHRCYTRCVQETTITAVYVLYGSGKMVIKKNSEFWWAGLKNLTGRIWTMGLSLPMPGLIQHRTHKQFKEWIFSTALKKAQQEISILRSCTCVCVCVHKSKTYKRSRHSYMFLTKEVFSTC